MALTRLPSEVTVPRLLAELCSERAQARSQALHTLSKIKDARAWPAITRSLLRDADDEVARSAWRAAVILVPGGQEKDLAEELAAQFGRGDRGSATQPGPHPRRPRRRSHWAGYPKGDGDNPGIRAHASATERLLHDLDSGSKSAIDEAKRTFALGKK